MSGQVIVFPGDGLRCPRGGDGRDCRSWRPSPEGKLRVRIPAHGNEVSQLILRSRRMSGDSGREERRVAALVGLSLLEVIREQDRPPEIFESENTAQTLPRRLGLSEVVEQQIRRFQGEVKRRGRMTDEEVKSLCGLVLKRPDAGAIFFQTGELLAGRDDSRKRVGRWYPRAIRFALARREFRRRCRALFGRPLGGFGPGGFSLEASGHFLLEMDPGGGACRLLSGLAQGILSRYFPDGIRVDHASCLGQKGDLCRWTAS